MIWLLTLASIIGTVANIYKQRWCFLVWLGTNAAWMVVDFRIGLYSQSAMFFVYTCLSVWGIIQWQKDGAENNDRRDNEGIEIDYSRLTDVGTTKADQ